MPHFQMLKSNGTIDWQVSSWPVVAHSYIIPWQIKHIKCLELFLSVELAFGSRSLELSLWGPKSCQCRWRRLSLGIRNEQKTEIAKTSTGKCSNAKRPERQPKTTKVDESRILSTQHPAKSKTDMRRSKYQRRSLLCAMNGSTEV